MAKSAQDKGWESLSKDDDLSVMADQTMREFCCSQQIANFLGRLLGQEKRATLNFAKKFGRTEIDPDVEVRQPEEVDKD